VVKPDLFLAADLRELHRLRRVLKGSSRGMRTKVRKRLVRFVAHCLKSGV